MAPSQWIYDVTDEDFAARVRERSRTVPVVVDFWAPWCGPCRALSPVIEHEVEALGGRVELARVNTDVAVRTAAEHRVSSIPMVTAFVDGAPADSFVGAQPTPVVRAFLARLAPSPDQQRLDQARAARAAGDPAAARTLLLPLVAAGATDPQVLTPAALLLARAALDLGDPQQAEQALGRVDPRHPDAEQAEVLRQVAALGAEAEAHGGVEAARAALARDPDDHAARFALAAGLAASGRIEAALDQLLDLIGRARRFRDDLPRRTLVALFDYLGPESDLAREYRRKLQVLL
jgi:putative thioredoxin